MNVKRWGKAILSRRLEAQVKQLRAKNTFTVVAVVGSVGKTTTKLTIASMLGTQRRVRYQTGNYNDRLTVPLIFFGQDQPGIFNIPAWLRILRSNARQLKQTYPYDIVVVELGSDGPGQIKDFAYIKPDITVVSALTDEHMAFFKTLDAVAEEELTAATFSTQTLINVDDSPEQYLSGISYLGYGRTGNDYILSERTPQSDGTQALQLSFGGKTQTITTSLLGEQGAKSILAGVAVADLCGLSGEQITSAAASVQAVPGRMQLLGGINNSTIIDDSYNASPAAMKAALDVLYATPAKQRIALLGNMNEMGELSPGMHKDIGEYCDPSKLNLVVTLGPDANEYLAPAAEAKGCTVQTFASPYLAGEFLKSRVSDGAAVLIKGSQNAVFAEEAIKSLLANPDDAQKLVRQSPDWLKKKHAQFKP
jgi:UDP-N-acetylmuramoyl-tripeptide--D-alanyl-D-alanine ligase